MPGSLHMSGTSIEHWEKHILNLDLMAVHPVGPHQHLCVKHLYPVVFELVHTQVVTFYHGAKVKHVPVREQVQTRQGKGV